MFNGSIDSFQGRRYPRRLYDSLQDHGFPVNPVPGVLYDSLQDHGFPVNPVPGVLYDSFHGIPENPIPGRVYCPIFPPFPILP